ncbi:hypothetical protein BOSE62_150035 [Bosea sp. 62]|nr:hypothetical protein BOSE7B_150105 [Bosea sp. 7B]CAD5273222.1 hypothetical protein BOSE46_20263 [Bosea sp. 46]VXB26489.1 hypothetical protein BOSE29B_10798 [Bosea sp. 29B]VXB65324.1 hypothetical protein BOSE62_150035 [Bosea sp. 62]VXC31185.1 hypothetical protein BOSE127_180106 [Bosea sp. 127]VXC59290.1 hypothetical protein BOSE125_30260 [Bosea sp. 125]
MPTRISPSNSPLRATTRPLTVASNPALLRVPMRRTMAIDLLIGRWPTEAAAIRRTQAIIEFDTTDT